MPTFTFNNQLPIHNPQLLLTFNNTPQKEYLALSRGPSLLDLPVLVTRTTPAPTNAATTTTTPSPRPNINTLPPEILTQILKEVVLAECHGSPYFYYSSMNSFARLLTTCFAFYDVGIPILYRHIAFADPHTFDKFLKSIQVTGYGILTKTLDFSGFTSVGLGRTAKMNDKIQMLTSSTISQALDLCPNLNEFLASENIEKDMDSAVLTKLFSQMPFLSALDFCGATDSRFVQALTATATTMPQSHVTRLSLHGCSTLPSSVIEALLSRLPHLTRLDLTHTQINSEALLAIPSSARLTHLSLSKCVRLSSTGTLKFLVLHKATRTLQWLNLLFDVTRPAPISSADLDTILRYLPPLKHLNLHGLPIRHLDTLPSMNLHSLSLGYAKFSIDTLKEFLPKLTDLEFLDLSGNPNINLWTIQDLSLLNANPNISMFEFSGDLLSKMAGVAIPGFSIALGQGRRAWLVRIKPTSKTTVTDTPTVLGSEQQQQQQKRFTFSAYAKTRMRNRSASPEATTHTKHHDKSVNIDLVGSPAWSNASRKINVCHVGIGGNTTEDACKERGIYLYYGYRK